MGDKKKPIPLSGGEPTGKFNAGSDALIRARMTSESPKLSNNGGEAPLKKNAGGGALGNVYNTPRPQSNPPPSPPSPPPPPPPKKKD